MARSALPALLLGSIQYRKCQPFRSVGRSKTFDHSVPGMSCRLLRFLRSVRSAIQYGHEGLEALYVASYYHDCMGVSSCVRHKVRKLTETSIVMIGMGFVTGFTSLLVTRILLGMICPSAGLYVSNYQVSLKLVSSPVSLSSLLNGTDDTRSTSESQSSSQPPLPLVHSVVFSHDSSISWTASTDTRVGDGSSFLKVSRSYEQSEQR